MQLELTAGSVRSYCQTSFVSAPAISCSTSAVYTGISFAEACYFWIDHPFAFVAGVMQVLAVRLLSQYGTAVYVILEFLYLYHVCSWLKSCYLAFIAKPLSSQLLLQSLGKSSLQESPSIRFRKPASPRISFPSAPPTNITRYVSLSSSHLRSREAKRKQ